MDRSCKPLKSEFNEINAAKAFFELIYSADVADVIGKYASPRDMFHLGNVCTEGHKEEECFASRRISESYAALKICRSFELFSLVGQLEVNMQSSMGSEMLEGSVLPPETAFSGSSVLQALTGVKFEGNYDLDIFTVKEHGEEVAAMLVENGYKKLDGLAKGKVKTWYFRSDGCAFNTVKYAKRSGGRDDSNPLLLDLMVDLVVSENGMAPSEAVKEFDMWICSSFWDGMCFTVFDTSFTYRMMSKLNDKHFSVMMGDIFANPTMHLSQHFTEDSCPESESEALVVVKWMLYYSGLRFLERLKKYRDKRGVRIRLKEGQKDALLMFYKFMEDGPYESLHARQTGNVI